MHIFLRACRIVIVAFGSMFRECMRLSGTTVRWGLCRFSVTDEPSLALGAGRLSCADTRIPSTLPRAEGMASRKFEVGQAVVTLKLEPSG